MHDKIEKEYRVYDKIERLVSVYDKIANYYFVHNKIEKEYRMYDEVIWSHSKKNIISIVLFIDKSFPFLL